MDVSSNEAKFMHAQLSDMLRTGQTAIARSVGGCMEAGLDTGTMLSDSCPTDAINLARSSEFSGSSSVLSASMSSAVSRVRARDCAAGGLGIWLDWVEVVAVLVAV
jgi:hypothetical protein